MTDGVKLKKGPGSVFPNITKLRKGEEVNFVRRTNIEFNKKNWLVVTIQKPIRIYLGRRRPMGHRAQG